MLLRYSIGTQRKIATLFIEFHHTTSKLHVRQYTLFKQGLLGDNYSPPNDLQHWFQQWSLETNFVAAFIRNFVDILRTAVYYTGHSEIFITYICSFDRPVMSVSTIRRNVQTLLCC
jgi:hypothetical protein